MPNVSIGEAEAAIAYVRGTLVEALAHRRAYNEWDHNICLAYVSMLDNGVVHREVLASYSHLSGLSEANLKKLYDLGSVEFVPDSIHFVGCNGMGKFHTEPRLLNYMLSRPGWIERVQEVTLVSEINCCTTCRKYAIGTFRSQRPGVGLFTIELGMNPAKDIGPQYTTL
jgi:hypothetical protein